jgi:hypothetical protein
MSRLCGKAQIALREIDMRIYFFIGIAICHLSLGACTTLPALEEATGGIPVRDIVLRIKCELSDAFVANDPQYKWLLDEPKFRWLRKWTAQVDLTLQVLDTATLSPGASLMQPFHNGYGVGTGPSTISTSGAVGTTISAVAQNFTLGGGLSVNGQSSRIETLSFALSFEELERWRQIKGTEELCAESDGTDLAGRLGLKEWIIDHALAPVAKEDLNLPELLWAGYHPKPISAGSGTPKNSTATSKKANAEFTTLNTSVCLPEVIEPIKKDFQNTLSMTSKNIDYVAKILKRLPPPNFETTIDHLQKELKSTDENLAKSGKTFDAYLADNKDFTAVLDPSIKSDEMKNREALSKAQSLVNGFDSAIDDNLKQAKLANSQVTSGLARARSALAAAQDNLGQASKIGDTEDGACFAFKAFSNAGDAVSQADLLDQLNTKSIQDVKNAEQNIKSLKSYVDPVDKYASSLKPLDPPISSIGQSVQFILNYQGNITPTWTFVRFKGPNNPLFSAGGTRTHMLNVTLGPIDETKGSNTPSLQVLQNQQNLLLNNLLPPISR